MHDDILADTSYGKPTKSWFTETHLVGGFNPVEKYY